MRTFGSAQELEARRQQAIRLLEAGLSPKEVSQQIGCSWRSVHHWQLLVKRHGKTALKAQPHPHRPSRMSQKQKERLQKELLKGPEAHGYPNQLWTLERIARVIETKFGIKYHPCHVWRIMDALGWSYQKPQRKAREQNEEQVVKWRQDDWPRIKQQASRGKKGGHFY